MNKLDYQIEKFIGVLSQSNSGWSKELNLVSWNQRAAKYDLREWDPDHQKMGKGITFTREELVALKELLDEIL